MGMGGVVASNHTTVTLVLVQQYHMPGGFERLTRVQVSDGHPGVRLLPDDQPGVLLQGDVGEVGVWAVAGYPGATRGVVGSSAGQHGAVPHA
jgi:hypothetical protein